MESQSDSTAFGAPGIEPRWTRSNKEGIGTAYHTSCRVWFTLSHGIVNEIYYPNVDCPNTRDLQFLITDGETFCHEERRDLDHQIQYPEQSTLYYLITNSEPNHRYRLIKEILADPHSSVFLMRTRLEILDESLRGKLKIYALLAPHMKGLGQHNSAWWFDIDCRPVFHVQREELHMVFGALPDFTRRSVGYVGSSDGWQDLMDNFKMDWTFQKAEDGNIALTAEIALSHDNQFVIGAAFGRSSQSASTKLLQSLAIPFDQHREHFIKQWQRTSVNSHSDLREQTGDEGHLFRLSRLILLAHEDKIFPGALVASMSIPWGETKSDTDLGGYHLVWTRDLVKSATALLAAGQTATPLRSLIWLAAIQAADGAVPQNSWIDGKAYWQGKQLDEVAAPILLAWRLRQANALGLFDPWTLVFRAARYLILKGPVTGQERWEENSGYSPSTLAWVIAALVCASEFAQERAGKDAAAFILDYADWLSAHLEGWTTTDCGELLPGKPRHYIRINPADPDQPDQVSDPNTALIQIANGGGVHPARNIVSADFLELVRLGIRAPLDPVVVDSISVADHVLKCDLPQGPCWRRYNHDGYGQKDDGSAFDGIGVGRCWPLLTGERAHYELAAGHDPLAFIRAIENFANDGGMLPEQVWDAEDLPQCSLRSGCPTGAAMPLCWAHGEYISLVRSRKEGVSFDCISPACERYARRRTASAIEMWTLAHRPPRIAAGKRLRIITEAPVTVHWSLDGWKTVQDTEAADSGLDCWIADLPANELGPGSRIVFTLRWTDRWEGRDFTVEIG
ncbi:MAG TPA: glycoside hydrolase family 15 protein [Verrucomicrobiae bacterium]|nr:glycoside hydrolase family 15 protein [Verrucomicrobiae bacterium]